MRGRLAPGARLTEADVSRLFGVSRTPAREATRRLLADGLLVAAGGGDRPRVAVAPWSSEAARELYLAAGALEGVAARRIADLTVGARTTLARSLRSADTAFARATRQRRVDFDQLFALHDEFHRQLMDACAGTRTRVLLATVRVQLDRYEWVYAPLVAPDFSRTFVEHRAIARAVRSADADRIETAVRANWFNAAERIAHAIDRAGPDAFGYGLRWPPTRLAQSRPGRGTSLG